jgi:zinc protease
MGGLGHHAAVEESKMKRAALCLILLSVHSPLVMAGAAEASWMLGREPVTYALDNGMCVILQRDEAAPITVMQLLVRSGDRDDPPGLCGLAYLTARLCLEIPDQTGLQQMMDHGSSFSLAVGGDYSLVTVRSLSRFLDPTLAVLAAMLGDPLFSDLRVDGVKRWMRLMQKMEVDDPVAFMRKAVASSFYAMPAYGAARFGDEESLARIGRKDIQSFFRLHYLAGNMVLVVVSDLDEADIKPLIARQLGRIPSGQRPPFRPVGLRHPGQPGMDVERQAAQALVSFSMPLPEPTTDSYVMVSLLETWLGKGIGSRLWSLRSQKELAYSITAEVQPNREAMLLSVFLKTGEQRRAEARAQLRSLLKAACKEGASQAELAAAKAFARADFWRENETRERRAAFLAFLEGSGLSYRLAGDLVARFEQVGLEEFNGFLRKWLDPERWFSLNIGPAAAE